MKEKMNSRTKKNRKAHRRVFSRVIRYLSSRLFWRRRLKALIPTPQEIDSFRVLNEIAIALMENKIKPELFRLHKDLMARLNRGEIDYNELRGNRFFSLRDEHICYLLWDLLRNIGEKQHQIFHCSRVWVDIKPMLQFVAQHPLDTGKRFQSGKINK